MPQSQKAAPHQNAPARQLQPHPWQIKALITNMRFLKSEISHHTQISWETNRKDRIVFRHRCCQKDCNYNHCMCHSCVKCPSPRPLSFQRVLIQEEELQIILQQNPYLLIAHMEDHILLQHFTPLSQNFTIYNSELNRKKLIPQPVSYYPIYWE